MVVDLTDVPDPPRFLNVDAIYHDSVMLTWKPPLNDGGGFITQYIVEKLEQGMANWIRCCTTRFIHLNSCLLIPSAYQLSFSAKSLTFLSHDAMLARCRNFVRLYRVAHKKRPELSHGIMQQRNQNESTE